MKILLISHSNSFGGAELCFLEMIKALSDKSEYEIYCVFPLHEGGLEEACSPFSIQTYRYFLPRWIDDGESFNTIEKIRKTKSILSSIVKAKRLLSQIKPDLVITNTSVIPQFAVASKLTRTKHIWFIHELVDEDFGCRYIYGKVLSKSVINRVSAAVITNSKFVNSRYVNYISAKKLRMIYQSVDIVSSVLKEKTNNGVLNLMIIGNISEFKGQKEAVEACNELYARGVSFHLFIVGIKSIASVSGLKSVMNPLIEKNIDFVPFTDRPQAYYEKTDIVLVCSHCEALGRVTIEAMKMGLPVVASNKGGNLELIQNGINGYLYEQGNSRDLADKIMLLDNQIIRTQFGQNGKQFADKNFSKREFGQQFENLIQQSIN